MSLALENFASETLRATSLGEGAVVGLSAGEYLFHEGDELNFIFEIVEGAMILYKMGIDGTRQLIGLRFRGDFLAVTGRDEHDCSGVAARSTRVRRISLAAVHQDIRRDPELGQRLLAACQRELLKTREQLLIVGSRSSTGRVAALLQDIAANDDRCGASFKLPLTRREMGDYLGMTIETVSRTMSKLKSLGIIALPRTDEVRILDCQRLRDLASGLDEGAARGRIMATREERTP